MVPVMAATGRRADKAVAMPTLEYLLRLLVPGLAALARIVVADFLIVI
jgi:hypothetical protein